MAGDHLVDTLGDLIEIAVELVGGDHHVDVAFVVLRRHVSHLGDHTLEVAAQGLDGLVDERFLARQLVERRIEIAAAELADAGHRLLLDRDVGTDEIVDALGDEGEIALEAVDGNHDVNVALLVLHRHPVHFRDQQ